MTIAHGFTHQWHGNMVTHVWWKEWWLTEGLTTYIQAFGLEALYPKQLVRQMQFIIQRQYSASNGF